MLHVSSSSHAADGNDASLPFKKPLSPKEFIVSVALKIASQPLQNSDPKVWGVLTAISSNACKRQQGINMLLTSDEHCIGRLVDDTRFQIDASTVSANHCKIYRKKVATEDAEHPSTSCTTVYLKDTSTNGTYLNWERMRKTSAEAKLNHGDIVSLAAPPQHEIAYAFVFRQVLKSNSLADGAPLKRKAEESGSESKRLKGIGIGAPEGPLSLDDFRSLQRSNMELRKQLENQVVTIDSLRNENRAAVERHKNEMKDLKESVSKSYLDQLKELQHSLENKQKELVEVQRLSAEQKHSMEGLNEKLSASMQSCTETNEILNSQKASISELKAQLYGERDQRREERENAVIELKTSIQRVQAEAQEKLKRLSDTSLRREREQQELINKLQEFEKERCLVVDTLRSKLEETRQKLVISDNKVRQLEAQTCDEQLASASERKRIKELEREAKKLRKELESEKAAREEAWAKVSVIELEINAVMRDLDFERRRLKGTRERIMFRETQLRAFYSTTEEISVLFAKQQEQLKAMRRTLEDEENYENTSIDIDLNVNPNNGDGYGTLAGEKEALGYRNNIAVNSGSVPSLRRCDRNHTESSSDEASATEKHDCDIRSQEDNQNTQEAEFTSEERFVKGGFGSDIDGVGPATGQEGDPTSTEWVPETESPGIDGDKNIDLNKCSALGGETMQMDDDTPLQEAAEGLRMMSREMSHHSQSNNPLENQNAMEDTEDGGTIQTADLLASEVAGSWAYGTAPSVHGENESPRRENDSPRREINGGGGGAALHNSNTQASQSTPCSETLASKRNHERQALSEMIGIVAPDLKDEFAVALDKGYDREEAEKDFVSISDTEYCTYNNDVEGVNTGGESKSDSETECSDRGRVCESNGPDDIMDEDDEATDEDSTG
ncbi:LOW QUALITY PROTEIN: protein CROWDED NUCLEI 3-like [Actinidia eriantha]|uniref:LOW QUALITY PROTEIN: protein CROWDED NUCLEI 3-like n=1 Tax=Actinidia eriantha TaxID=165200 RepID=UPI002590B850|nr:LOW QUALITY PROTEIN: protein CROWDED NUCLEI 3-like [Actinidia eriantha]